MEDWDEDMTSNSNTQGRGQIFKMTTQEKSAVSGGWDAPADTSSNGWSDKPSSNGWGNESSSGFGGSRGGGGGGRGGGNKCFNCQGDGHMSRECPQPRAERGRGGRGGGAGGGRACYNCQKEGHNSRDCPEPRSESNRGGRGGGRGGFSSGGDSSSWGASDTNGSSDAWGSSGTSGGDAWASSGGGGGFSSGGGGGGSRKCFNCNEEGHNSRDCPQPRAERGGRGGGRGRGGGSSGGGGGSWGSAPSGGDDAWGSGGGAGGGSGDGGNRGKDCFNCGEEGHNSRDCPNPKTSSGGGGGGCRRCGQEGHFAKECTEPGEDGRVPVTYVPEEEDESEANLFHRGTEAGINFSKYDNVPVKVSGENAPRAITSFETSGLRPFVIENIKKAGYSQPTPVQKHAIPIVLAKRDLMACAQTGSGKTAAYLVPIINHLLDSGCSSSSFAEIQTPEAVVMCPTRELAIQIEKEAKKFAFNSVIKTVVVYGGVQPRSQSEKVKQGCNILVATPGRLLDFLEKGIYDFSKCQFLVLDEADRMLDMGFKEDVKRAVYHKSTTLKGERVTLMFSATFPNEVQSLAAEFLNDYLFLAVGMVGGACSDVKQMVIPVEHSERNDKLKDILREHSGVKTLIFTSAKKSADFLAAMLSSDDFSATSIHGDRLQQQREEAVRDFTTGKRNILVATAVAARGLDIKGVGLVINYEMPKELDEYVHRIGRTGRVGNTGLAISFFNESKDSELAGKLVEILSNAQQEVPDFLQAAASGMSFGGGNSNRFGGSDMRNFGRNVQAQVENDDSWE